jgi:hypothetical protein
MAQTALDICNLAIAEVGGERIDEIGEDTPVGAFCQSAYPATRDWLLSRHRWVFAKQIVQLNRLATTPSGAPMANAFTRPGDVVGAVHAFRDGPREDAWNVPVSQMADYIAADQAVVWAEYTAQRPEATWPMGFHQLVVIGFAEKVARFVMQSSKADELHRKAFGGPQDNGEGGLFLAAKIEDGRNAPQRQLFYDSPGPLIEARFGGGCGPFGWGPVNVIVQGI